MVRKRNSDSGKAAENFLTQRRRNPPRIKVSGRVSNNTTVHGTELINSLSTNSDGVAVRVVPLIGGSSLGLATAFAPLQSIARLYNEFLFKSSSVRYIPSVGMTAPGNVTIAFVNNTEVCSYVMEATRTYAELEAIAFGQANAVTHPVWHEFSYSMNLPSRRKRFDINYTNPTLDIDTIERDCQGVFIILVTGATPSTGIAVPRRESTMLLEGLSTNIP